MKRKNFFLLLLFIFFFLEIEAQCAMCRAVLESEGSQETAKSVNNGIKYLMLFPYLLIGGLGYFIYRKYRNS